VSVDRPHAKTDRRLKQLHRIALSKEVRKKFPLTEKIEELFLAWMITDLDSSGFSRSLRVLGLEQNF
jgi:hypothetical protein